MQPAPVRIAAVGDSLAVAWRDGSESYLSLADLRRACPCAACCGEPHLTGHTPGRATPLRPESFALRSFEWIGGYAIQPVWGDGHSTGIYPFALLKQIGDTAPHSGEAST